MRKWNPKGEVIVQYSPELDQIICIDEDARLWTDYWFGLPLPDPFEVLREYPESLGYL